ncbi:hypothetical protein KQX54_000133 [Cotesia glomerata]|uniref:Uncharacterized protein n=1 Tax=Cotesia glomerata TaxID=32391 RepID=A0AAV7IBN7_COTGL|nr:hypothetical protein KQX54_000133 [Cotesia glomerata]
MHDHGSRRRAVEEAGEEVAMEEKVGRGRGRRRVAAEEKVAGRGDERCNVKEGSNGGQKRGRMRNLRLSEVVHRYLRANVIVNNENDDDNNDDKRFLSHAVFKFSFSAND